MSNFLKFLIPIFCLLAALLFFLLPSSDSKEEKIMQERGLQIQEIDDPEGPVTETAVVASGFVPQTMQERQTAPSIALLPHRTGYPEMRGEIPINEAEKRIVKKRAEKFLALWETYQPGESGYKEKLKGFVAPEDLPGIALRQDSIDPPDVCPDAGCRLGSSWYDPPRFSDSAFVIDKEDSRIFLVAYGAVLYGDGVSQERSSERSYGLIMRNTDGAWLIERIASESLR